MFIDFTEQETISLINNHGEGVNKKLGMKVCKISNIGTYVLFIHDLSRSRDT